MAIILISYDLKETTKEIHKQVKDEMKSNGYSDKCGQKGILPNTCLWKDTTIPNSINDLKASVTKFKGVLERYISSEIGKNECDDLTTK